jgi:CheY-like chemotaxis protein
MLTPLPDARAHVLLIADDHPAVPDLVIRILAGAGLWVVAADRPRSVPTDTSLVILDTGPCGTGLRALLAAVRALAPKVPILVLLASAEPDTWTAIAEDGRTGALEKPFSPGALVQAVHELMAAPSHAEGTR